MVFYGNARKVRCVRQGMFVKLIMRRECWNIMKVYSQGMRRNEETREIFWNDLKWCIGCCEDKGRVVE